MTFPIYEIEHPGDEQTALESLRAAGCTNIKVIVRDYDSEERIVVQCDLPQGVTLRQLEEQADLCL